MGSLLWLLISHLSTRYSINIYNITNSSHTTTSRFPISPDLCPWSWPPPIGQALCLPTRPLGSHLWTRVRQQIYPASGLIPLLEQLPLASPEPPPALLFWPMATTYWTGLPTFQSGLIRHCLTCSQLDSSPCPELSLTSTLSELPQKPTRCQGSPSIRWWHL